MINWFPTDEQVIDGLRRAQRYRRPIGAICACLGLAGIAVILYGAQDLRQQSLAALDQLGRTPHSTTQQVAQALDDTRFHSGILLGFVLGAGLTETLSLAVFGFVWLLVSDRKDKMLIKCWDNQPPTRASPAVADNKKGSDGKV